MHSAWRVVCPLILIVKCEVQTLECGEGCVCVCAGR